MIVLRNSTDVSTYFSLRLLATGANATGLAITDLDLQYVRSGAAPSAKVDATALAAAGSAHADNKAIEVDPTNQPGLYRVDWPDAAFATGAREVILSVKHTSCFVEHLRVELNLANAVWDEPAYDHIIGGSTGQFQTFISEMANGSMPVTARLQDDSITSYAVAPSGADEIAAAIWAASPRTLTGIVDANVEQVNGTTVQGSGTAGSPWGPP